MYLREDDLSPWYVGKGCKYRKRHYNKKLAKEFACPTDDNLIMILKDNLTEAQAYELEVETIAKYGRKCDGGILENKCLGGPGARGFKHDPNRPSPMKGRKHTDEAKAKMAEKRKGNSNRATVTYILTDPDGNQMVVKNLANFCRERELNRKALTNVLCGRSKTHNGWTITRAEVC